MTLLVRCPERSSLFDIMHRRPQVWCKMGMIKLFNGCLKFSPPHCSVGPRDHYTHEVQKSNPFKRLQLFRA
jgi:hypothetical protein